MRAQQPAMTSNHTLSPSALNIHEQANAPSVLSLQSRTCLHIYFILFGIHQENQGERKADEEHQQKQGKRQKETKATLTYDERMAYYGAFRLTSLPIVTHTIQVLVKRTSTSDPLATLLTGGDGCFNRRYSLAMVV